MGDGGSSAAQHQVIDPIMGMDILSGRRLLPEDFNPTEHSLLSYLDKMCNSSFREQERSSPSALHNPFHVLQVALHTHMQLNSTISENNISFKALSFGTANRIFLTTMGFYPLAVAQVPCKPEGSKRPPEHLPTFSTEAPGQEALQGSLPPSLGLFVSAARD